MKSNNIPPHIILDSTKEVIFYIDKKLNIEKNIQFWVNELKIPDYKGMIINSKCVFNRLREKECE